MDLTSRVYWRHVLALAKTIDLSHYDLEGLLTGKPVTLYHGTTRSFTKFDPKKSREDLVNKYYGGGIFFSPSKKVAWDYADANRNIGFDPEIVGDMKRVNSRAGEFLELLVHDGTDAWDKVFEEVKKAYPGEGVGDAITKYLNGVDANTLNDIAGYIIGSKINPLGAAPDALDMFFGQSTGAPSWVYSNLDEVGIDSKKYRPKVYTVSVSVKNTLVTKLKAQARAASKKGYDCVVFYGSGLVGGVPEVAVFDPSVIHIKSVEVGD